MSGQAIFGKTLLEFFDFNQNVGWMSLPTFNTEMFYDTNKYPITYFTKAKIETSTLKLDGADNLMKDYYSMKVTINDQVVFAEKTYKDFVELKQYIVAAMEHIKKSNDQAYADEAFRVILCMPSLPVD